MRRITTLVALAAAVTACSDDEGTAAGGGDAADEPPICADLPPGPFEPELVLSGLAGTEDFAFDSKGRMAARAQGQLLLVTAKAKTTVIAPQLPGSFGLRFRSKGHLAVALPGAGQLVDVAPDGEVTLLADDLELPNGVFPDAEGNVWVTEMQGDRVIKVTADGEVEVIAEGKDAPSPNGIVIDSARKALYYTQFGTGIVMRVDLATEGAAPVEVTTLPDANPDGLTLDACGNLYAVDNGNARLFRVELDDAGEATADPELLAEFPASVANAQFGRAGGFDKTKLYVAGQPGKLFALPIGVGGAK